MDVPIHPVDPAALNRHYLTARGQALFVAVIDGGREWHEAWRELHEFDRGEVEDAVQSGRAVSKPHLAPLALGYIRARRLRIRRISWVGYLGFIGLGLVATALLRDRPVVGVLVAALPMTAMFVFTFWLADRGVRKAEQENAKLVNT